MTIAPSPPRRWLRRGLLALFAALALLAAIVVVNTLRAPSRQLEPGAFEPLAVDDEQALEHLAAAVRLQTISPEDPADFDPAPFTALHAALERAYPKVHATLTRERVADYSSMYRWQGSDPDARPIILTAHMDVVPPGDLERWTHPPFSAQRVDGALWGRGSMDDKGGLIAILEAAEAMLAAGITPTRTIYLCFGHDEELTGAGAQAMAARLAERGVTAELLVDEGMGITDGLFPGMTQPLALVGVAEKGYVILELSVEHPGGHGSAPPEHTAIGILAQAITRVEDQQMPASVAGPFRESLETAGPEMRGPIRFIATNLWLFEPVLLAVLLGDETTAATVRTTTAVTVIEGGVKANVLPSHASAKINHRLNYGDTVQDVMDHVIEVIDDPRVSVSLVAGNEVSRLSSTDAPAFEQLARSLREARPEIAVAPTLFVGASDARHYEAVAEQIYRISPFIMDEADVARFHGFDERLREEDFMAMIQFYGRLMQLE
ncbi:M20/M25/M40 family metallo-hydrolase [Pseudenhygromyxa sp. WMMC2535]|uniref:M20/M25/M40 family metallo-hydrolase n=1 Tax=Pseudenhygromyxa sp. WMMC2535 TaxID=2712867 RepID=UPI001553FFD5|nr:M20/M25/M40 family metallo-hydrolase [Pseudenhygromyxa sp. WMMC2535]NVB37513.1 M20/M25/M40 family metallo-hydrolase [Pseudenhygromyxa sp. WMMC2535]